MTKRRLMPFAVVVVILSFALALPPAAPAGPNLVQYLSPPIVGSPAYGCGTVVVLSGYTVGATVRVYANSSELLAEGAPYYTYWEAHLNRALKEGDVLTAVQVIGDNSSYPSLAPVATERLPADVLEHKWAPPEVVSPLYACQQIVGVNKLLEGCLTEVFSGTSTLLGTGETPFQNARVGTAELVQGTDISARQSICGTQYQSPTSPPQGVQPAPPALPPPWIDEKDLVVGAGWVTVKDAFTGSTVEVFHGDQRVGGAIAPGPNVAFPVNPPVTKDGSKYRADESLCGGALKSSSAPVVPIDTLGPLEIEVPICSSSTSVSFRNAATNATIKFFQNGVQVGQGGGSPPRTTLSLGGGVVLKDGDVITAMQQISTIVSPLSAPVSVGCASYSIYSADPGYAGKCLTLPAPGGYEVGDPAILEECNQYHMGLQKTWLLEPAGAADTYRIISVHSGMCLEISAGSQSNGDVVRQTHCTAVDYQQFAFLGTTRQLVARHSGKCLQVGSVPGSSSGPPAIEQRDCDPTNGKQTWQLERVSAPKPPFDTGPGEQCNVCNPSNPKCATGLKCLVTNVGQSICCKECSAGAGCAAGYACQKVGVPPPGSSWYLCVPTGGECPR